MSQHSRSEPDDAPTEQIEVPPVRAARPASPTTPPLQPSQARRWPWVAGVIAASFLSFVVGVGVGAAPTVTSVSSAGPYPLVGGVPVTAFTAPFKLEVSSKLGREMNVSYDNGTGGMDSARPMGQWSMTIPTRTQYWSGSLSVSSGPSLDEYMNDNKQSDTVTCRITDSNGEVIDEQTGTGENASAYCSGY